METATGCILINRVGGSIEPGSRGRPLKLGLEGAMPLDLLHLQLVSQLIALLLLDRLWLGQLGHSLLMCDLLVTSVIRSIGPLRDCWLEAAVLHMLVLDLLDDFSGLAGHHWRPAVGSSDIVVLLEVVRHGRGVELTLDVAVHGVLLHCLRSTCLLLLLLNHLPPLSCSFDANLVERLLVPPGKHVVVQNLARIQHVRRLSGVGDGPRPRAPLHVAVRLPSELAVHEAVRLSVWLPQVVLIVLRTWCLILILIRQVCPVRLHQI